MELMPYNSLPAFVDGVCGICETTVDLVHRGDAFRRSEHSFVAPVEVLHLHLGGIVASGVGVHQEFSLIFGQPLVPKEVHEHFV